MANDVNTEIPLNSVLTGIYDIISVENQAKKNNLIKKIVVFKVANIVNPFLFLVYYIKLYINHELTFEYFIGLLFLYSFIYLHIQNYIRIQKLIHAGNAFLEATFLYGSCYFQSEAPNAAISLREFIYRYHHINSKLKNVLIQALSEHINSNSQQQLLYRINNIMSTNINEGTSGIRENPSESEVIDAITLEPIKENICYTFNQSDNDKISFETVKIIMKNENCKNPFTNEPIYIIKKWRIRN